MIDFTQTRETGGWRGKCVTMAEPNGFLVLLYFMEGNKYFQIELPFCFVN